MSDGILSIRSRALSMKEMAENKVKQTGGASAQLLHGAATADASSGQGSFEFVLKGRGRQGNKTDFVVQQERKQKLQPYDKYLKRFKYRKALDAALHSYKVCPCCFFLLVVRSHSNVRSFVVVFRWNTMLRLLWSACLRS
jgi:hypothetical protein